jgi:hypothetical protein
LAIGYWLEDGTGRKALAVQKAVPSIVTVAAESTLPVPISANAGSYSWEWKINFILLPEREEKYKFYVG